MKQSVENKIIEKIWWFGFFNGALVGIAYG